MIAAPRKYQACFFADFADVRPSVETIPPLLSLFQDRGLLPNTYQEIGFLPSAAPQARLRLSSPDNEWVIEFETPRINIEKNAIKPFGANLGPPEEFTRNAIGFLDRILGRFPKKANRLSLVTDGLMGEMPETKLQDLYPRLLVPLDFYEQNPPLNWNSRSVARIFIDLDGNREQLNVITQVNRVHGQFVEEGNVTPYDRIQVVIDINTYQGNTDPRFQIAAVRAFYPEALKIRERLLSALKERLNG